MIIFKKNYFCCFRRCAYIILECSHAKPGNWVICCSWVSPGAQGSSSRCTWCKWWLRGTARCPCPPGYPTQVSHEGKSYIKGTVQRDLLPPFFPSFEPAWATNQQVKTFSILVKISPSYSNFSDSPRGIIPRRANLPGVSYPASHLTFLVPN